MQAQVNTKKILMDYVAKFSAYTAKAEITRDSENLIVFIGWLSEQEEPSDYKEAVGKAITFYTSECYVKDITATVSGLLGHVNNNS